MNLNIAGVPLPLRFRPEKPMSDEELLYFSGANELLWVEREASGEIHVKPIAGCYISSISVAVICALSEWSRRDGCGQAFANAGFSLADGSMRGAYAAWMCSEKWQPLSKKEKQGFAPMCPDFVVEILGPFDKLKDMKAKMEQWIANGAQLAWLINPDTYSVTVYRPGEKPEVLDNPDVVRGEGAVAGLNLEMAQVWEKTEKMRSKRHGH